MVDMALNEKMQRIIEYPELEGIHRDYRVQLLAPHRTTQKSNHISESIVQTLLELRHGVKVEIALWVGREGCMAVAIIET